MSVLWVATIVSTNALYALILWAGSSVAVRLAMSEMAPHVKVCYQYR